MACGYWGKILKINLENLNISVDYPDNLFYRTYMGGACLGAYYLLKEMPPGTDAFDPANIMVFSPGIATGARGPGLARHTVITKSPLSGGIGESQAEGLWGSELKRAGWDAIVISGRAQTPIYISISDSTVSFKSAEELWGKSVADVHGSIVSDSGDPGTRVAVIGQAGENMVRYASIITDLAFAHNRLGVGAVMGSKNLKAISVRGTMDVCVSDPVSLESLNDFFSKHFSENSVSQATHEFGMGGLATGLCRDGLVASRNYRSSFMPGVEKTLNSENILSHNAGDINCFNCPQACQKKTTAPGLSDTPYAAPELELLCMFGSNCGIPEYSKLLEINELCYSYGLDRNSTGSVIAFVMDAWDRGLIDQDHLSGIELGDEIPAFGNGDAALALIHAIALRRGLGAILAEGTQRAAAVLGNKFLDLAVQSKGVELPAHDPRTKAMLGLGYAISPIGPSTEVVEHDTDFDETAPVWMIHQNHTMGVLRPMRADILDEYKTGLAYRLQQVFSFMDSLCLCIFAFVPVRFLQYHHISTLLQAVCGWDISLFELMQLGRRRITMFRVFNLREGLSARDDWLPEKVFQPIPDGPRKGQKMDKSALRRAIKDYYTLAGWDRDTGVPTRVSLAELDISWCDEYL
ncbi:aldehyde ferredoxin oxidoreductase C-terminal domain-containing protein [Marispirochaeta aestuarii]|uniref:aldehyde ferredoxin oxidoreductase family protein n=1 Tax=Marispirochaeta aestuarii TaxID=1963862 RepID=UPI0029C8ECD9|nr:aldehyde ferredoxin oxidoreductase C-terminal domain-containing protein [Marispirochaeta aestuarii]